jgi:hypothetical protein
MRNGKRSEIAIDRSLISCSPFSIFRVPVQINWTGLRNPRFFFPLTAISFCFVHCRGNHCQLSKSVSSPRPDPLPEVEGEERRRRFRLLP